MQMLDAILAFALTLAAAATVATIVIEILHRSLQLRRRNLAVIVARLAEELEGGPIALAADDRTAFLTGVLLNPVGPGGGDPASRDRVARFVDAAMDSLRRRTGVRAKVNGFLRWRDGRCLYDHVSLEHVLRRLADTRVVRAAVRDSTDRVTRELERIARRFEELGSAVGNGFRRKAQSASLVAGFVIALVANIDGLRIFDTYLGNNELTASVISQQAALERSYTDAVARLDAVLEDLSDASDEDPRDAIEVITDRVATARRQVDQLVDLGVPIGWRYYPACWDPEIPSRTGNALGANPHVDARCRAMPEPPAVAVDAPVPARIHATLGVDTAGIILWLVAIVVTGLLIGLGAPFWFDVAKRVNQIRHTTNAPHASAENRLSGRDANGDPDLRERIVRRVVSDTLADVAPGQAASG